MNRREHHERGLQLQQPQCQRDPHRDGADPDRVAHDEVMVREHDPFGEQADESRKEGPDEQIERERRLPVVAHEH